MTKWRNISTNIKWHYFFNKKLLYYFFHRNPHANFSRTLVKIKDKAMSKL